MTSVLVVLASFRLRGAERATSASPDPKASARADAGVPYSRRMTDWEGQRAQR
jgi:hypothetical protein